MKIQISTPERRKIVEDAIAKFLDNQKMSKRGLASYLVTNHPEHFNNIEHARTAIRYQTGTMGDRARKIATSNYAKSFKDNTGFVWEMPRSHIKEWSPYDLPAGDWLVLSDLHVPFHVPEAINIALDYGEANGMTDILINGDFWDGYGISRFDKQLNRVEGGVKTELIEARRLLGYLRKRYPKSRIIYKLGNHDEWWSAYLWRKAPEIADMPQMELARILTDAVSPSKAYPQGLSAVEGIEFIDEQRIIRAGKLGILHGHELGRGVSNPVNFARTLALRTLESCLAGHVHQTSHQASVSMFDSQMSCWSTGCLCDLHPPYARINKMNHGFAFLKFDGKNFEVDNKRIIKGKVF